MRAADDGVQITVPVEVSLSMDPSVTLRPNFAPLLCSTIISDIHSSNKKIK